MHFLIHGTDAHTSQPVSLQLEASDANAAVAAAARMGIQIFSLDVQHDSPPGPVPPAPPLPPDAAASAAPATCPAVAPAPLNYASTFEATNHRIQRRWIWITGLLTIEALIAFALYAWALFAKIAGGGLSDPSDFFYMTLPFLVGTIILFAIQLAFLSPVARPRAADRAPQSPWLWLSAIALGLLLGICVCVAIAMFADLLWCLDATTNLRDAIAGTGLFLAIVSWILSTPLVILFMRRRRPESTLAMGAAAIFLGSTLEFAAAIPLLSMINRKNDCYCASYTFWSMFLTSFTGFLLLGPIILLVLFARRTRAVSKGFCAACGFDLRTLPNRDRCPRCGAGWKV